jgi:adenylate cyclase
MATEIERKFLVAQDWSTGDLDPVPVRQGYLTDNGAGTEVRVRAHGQDRLMTVKRSRSSSGASVRTEIEFPVPEDVFDELWLLTEGQRVAKLRYTVPLAGALEATVDVYADRNDGLRVVEVEFPDEQAAADFTAPDWFGPEVTGDPRYGNRRLAQ